MRVTERINELEKRVRNLEAAVVGKPPPPPEPDYEGTGCGFYLLFGIVCGAVAALASLAGGL